MGRLHGKTERRFWAEFSAQISGMCAEFGRKNSSMVPHLLFFRSHVYGFHLVSAHFLSIFHLFSDKFALVLWEGVTVSATFVSAITVHLYTLPVNFVFPIQIAYIYFLYIGYY